MLTIRKRLVLVGLCGVAVVSLAAVADDEERSSLDAIPAAARAAILQEAGGNAITGVEQETEDGVTRYEAEWTANGVEHEVAVLADGALVETEEVVTLAQVPAAVRATIEKEFGKGAKVAVEKKMVVLYEAEGKSHGEGKEIVILPSGRVHGTAQANDAAEEDDD